MISDRRETQATLAANPRAGFLQTVVGLTGRWAPWHPGGLFACLLLALSSTAGTSIAEVSRGTMETLDRRCQGACVEVLVGGRHVGSGWYASRDGFVVTASHLFGDGDSRRIELLAGDDSRTAATLVAIDRGHDLAVLRTASLRGPDQWLPLAPERPALGEEIFQFGAPLFRSAVLQPGHIAATRTVFEYYGDLREYVEIVHVAGMMQSGTSGGAWLNANGEVVGLQSGVMSQEGRPVGIAYMVPGEFVRDLLGMQHNARTPTLGLGVDELWQQSEAFLQKLPAGTGGLVVAVLQDAGPAAQAGLKTQDVIISVDGEKVIRIREFLRKIRSHEPGSKVTLGVLTSGDARPAERQITLGLAEKDTAPASNKPEGSAP